jgi:hypothetical protein
MKPFNGDKIRPRLPVRAGSKTFSWLFDTGAAVTCMNKNSFDLAFGQSKPIQISKPQSCVAASGDKMSSYGVFEVHLFKKGKKFTHPVNLIQELNENIIDIDFIHAHKLTYDVISRKVRFAGAGTNSIAALKNTVLPAITSTVVKAKFKGTREEIAIYVANICAPRTPMISGMPSIMNVDQNIFATSLSKTVLPTMSLLKEKTFWESWKQKRMSWYLSLTILYLLCAKTFIAAFQKWRGKDYPWKKSNDHAICK